MNTRAIVMADGNAKRWTKRYPKQLIRIDGEFLIHRTIRLLKKNGITDIIVTTHDPLIKLSLGVPVFEPINNDTEIGKFLSPKPIWKGETLFIYGDCYFTEDAMKTIVEGDTMFYGTSEKKDYKDYGEIFAVKIISHDLFATACQDVIEAVEKGNMMRGGAWELYHYMTLGSYYEPKPNITTEFTEINDETDDFDSMEDLEGWKKKYTN